MPVFCYIKNPDVINTTVGIISKVNDNKPPAFNLVKFLINLNKEIKKVNVKMVIIIRQPFIIMASMATATIIALKFNKS